MKTFISDCHEMEIDNENVKDHTLAPICRFYHLITFNKFCQNTKLIKDYVLQRRLVTSFLSIQVPSPKPCKHTHRGEVVRFLSKIHRHADRTWQTHQTAHYKPFLTGLFNLISWKNWKCSSSSIITHSSRKKISFHRQSKRPHQLKKVVRIYTIHTMHNLHLKTSLKRWVKSLVDLQQAHRKLNFHWQDMHKIFSFEEKHYLLVWECYPGTITPWNPLSMCLLTYKNLSFGETLKILHAGCPLPSFMRNWWWYFFPLIFPFNHQFFFKRSRPNAGKRDQKALRLTECSFKRCVKYVCIMAIPAIAGFSPSSQKKQQTQELPCRRIIS